MSTKCSHNEHLGKFARASWINQYKVRLKFYICQYCLIPRHDRVCLPGPLPWNWLVYFCFRSAATFYILVKVSQWCCWLIYCSCCHIAVNIWLVVICNKMIFNDLIMSGPINLTTDYMSDRKQFLSALSLNTDFSFGHKDSNWMFDFFLISRRFRANERKKGVKTYYLQTIFKTCPWLFIFTPFTVCAFKKKSTVSMTSVFTDCSVDDIVQFKLPNWDQLLRCASSFCGAIHFDLCIVNTKQSRLSCPLHTHTVLLLTDHTLLHWDAQKNILTESWLPALSDPHEHREQERKQPGWI